MQEKRKPLRMCVGCREMKPKEELIRVARSPRQSCESSNSQVEFSLDFTGKKPGRGAYICNKLSCFEIAQRAKKFERSFKCKIPQHIYQDMGEELKQRAK